MYGNEDSGSGLIKTWLFSERASYRHIIDLIFFSPQTIETVEQEVERLLEEDAAADEVKFGKYAMW